VDISADVDFIALAEAAIKASPGIEVHGPVEQGAWLGAMGIRERADALIQKSKAKRDATDGVEERVSRIEGGWKRLVDQGPTGMGRIYKAMAIVPHNPGEPVRRPVGFGGGVGL
jgi:SAM-dependent MidA family methyltransferase